MCVCVVGGGCFLNQSENCVFLVVYSEWVYSTKEKQYDFNQWWWKTLGNHHIVSSRHLSMKGNNVTNVSVSEMMGPAVLLPFISKEASLHNSCPCHVVLVAKRKNQKQSSMGRFVKANYLAVVFGEYNLVWYSDSVITPEGYFPAPPPKISGQPLLLTSPSCRLPN